MKTTAAASKDAGLPAFVVIGAMKSGTSSLHHYLRQHPEICMSRPKETDYFIEERNYGKGLHWYRSLFADQTKVCGEASPNYSKRHRHRGVPGRLYRLVPDVRLIYILRDPIDRTLSHYLHNRDVGREVRPLAEAIAARSYRNNYVRTSMYRFQLEVFLRRFPLERILIVTTEDLKEKQPETLQKIFRFIGVDPHFEGSEFGRRFNQTPVAGPPSDRLARPALEREERDRLAEHLAPDVAGLRALTGLGFERWCL
jgi:hypothetical protein